MKKITYNGESKILIALCNLVNELVDAEGSAGGGDMKKSVYDTNGNGIVDNAEKVNNHTVNANVPEDAKFTDSNTTYTLGKSDGKITLTDSDGLKQEVDVPSTDTNTTYTMTFDGSKLTLTDSDGKTQDVTLPSGDMKKSVYDTDGNGIVDNAEKVNNHTVNANVPENAVFTDTTYTFSQSGSQLTLTDNDGNVQSVNVPSTELINEIIDNHEERLTLTEYMNIHNDYFAPLMDDEGHVILDDDDNAIMVDWKYKYA